MKILLNGKDHEFIEKITIEELLLSLQISRDGIAVAKNDEVIPRSEHSACKISGGDRLEIIRAVGGG